MGVSTNKFLQKLKFLPIVIALGLACVFYYAHFHDYFMAVEARCWIALEPPVHTLWKALSNLGNTLIQAVIDVLSLNPVVQTRRMSMATTSFNTYLCGLDSSCHNDIQLSYLIATGALMFSFLVQLGQNPILAALVPFAWLFTQPVIDTLSWQATIHDKLSALFSWLSLVSAMFFYKRRLKPVGILASNIICGVFVVWAYSCKESSFTLLPSILLLYFLLPTGDDFLKRLRNLDRLVMPIVFVLFHNILFLRQFLTGPANEHETGGAIGPHLQAYIGYFLNSSSDSPWIEIASYFSLGIFVLALDAWFFRLKSRKNRSIDLDVKLLVWSFLALFASIVIALRTQFFSPFYMVTPGSYAFIFLFFVLKFFYRGFFSRLEAVAKRKLSIPIRSSILLGSLSLLFYLHIHQFIQICMVYRKSLIHESQELVQALPIIREKLKNNDFAKSIYFVYPFSNYRAYFFTGEGCFYPFLFNTNDPDKKGGARFKFTDRSKLPSKFHGFKDGYSIVMEEDLGLHSIYDGKTRLYLKN